MLWEVSHRSPPRRELREDATQALRLFGAQERTFVLDINGVWLTGEKLDNLLLIGLSLRKAVLANADLNITDFSKSSLIGADLRKASINLSTMYRTDLTMACLCGANLQQTDFTEAELLFADLTDANLSSLNLDGADISGGNFSNARGLSQSGFDNACEHPSFGPPQISQKA
jgi:uncharacterized protein YjbI with pentapeptide repeats